LTWRIQDSWSSVVRALGFRGFRVDLADPRLVVVGSEGFRV